MTREEAIEWVKAAMIDFARDDERSDEILTARDMAISALEQEPCEDAISREYLFKVLDDFCGHARTATITLDTLADIVYELPSVTQKSGKCKNCKYFEYDSVAKVDGIPLIVAHEICNKWGDGCKTREDGYCFLFEPQESEDKEKEMPWYLSIFNTELLKQKGHWITDDAWSDIAYNTEFLEFLYNHINPNDMEHYRQMFEMKNAVAVNGAEKESSDERDSD